MSEEYASLKVKADFLRQLKVWAALRGITMMDFVEEAVYAKLASEGKSLKEHAALYELEPNPPASP